jgi:hypothetical protein
MPVKRISEENLPLVKCWFVHKYDPIKLLINQKRLVSAVMQRRDTFQ